jgi:hypothetical protein
VSTIASINYFRFYIFRKKDDKLFLTKKEANESPSKVDIIFVYNATKYPIYNTVGQETEYGIILIDKDQVIKNNPKSTSFLKEEINSEKKSTDYLRNAQSEYNTNKWNSGSSAYRFEGAFNFIDSCKEQLNGETNPNVMYLEIKIRYKYDSHITKTKELISQFIDTYTKDNRIEELADLLIEINNSDDFCADGKRKRYGFINDKGLVQRHYFDSNCNLKKLYLNKNNSNFTNVKLNHYKDGKLIEEVFFDENGTQTQRITH